MIDASTVLRTHSSEELRSRYARVTCFSCAMCTFSKGRHPFRPRTAVDGHDLVSVEITIADATEHLPVQSVESTLAAFQTQKSLQFTGAT